MTHVLEPEERLFSPEYWGVDINDDAAFEDVGRQLRVTLSPEEQQAADEVLASCLVEVARGDYAEMDYYPDEELAPTHSELADGSVLILDTEHLTQYDYFPGSQPTLPDQEPTGTMLPLGDFAELWFANQPKSGDDESFSSEVASLPSEDMLLQYHRALEWGVLVTHEDERAVASWTFDAPGIVAGAIKLPRWDDAEIFRIAEVLPIAYRKTAANTDFYPNAAAEILDINLPKVTRRHRTMDRLMGVKIIHAAKAEYKPEDKSGKGRGPRIKSALGKLVLPGTPKTGTKFQPI